MFELFMYVYSCNALLARFFDVDRALNSYIMIMIAGPFRTASTRGDVKDVPHDDDDDDGDEFCCSATTTVVYAVAAAGYGGG